MPQRPIISGIAAEAVEIVGARHINASAALTGAVNGEARGGDMSANGRYVVFVSTASNLVEGDTNGATDIFRRDLWTGRTELISATTAGVIGNGGSGETVAFPYLSQPTISEDGRYVGFVSAAQNLPNARPGKVSGYVKDMQTGLLVNLSANLETQRNLPVHEAQQVVMGQGAEAMLLTVAVTVETLGTLQIPALTTRFYLSNGDVAAGKPRYVNFSPPFTNPPDGFQRAAIDVGSGVLGADVAWAWSKPTTAVLTQTWENHPEFGDTNDLGDVYVSRADGTTTVISRQLSGPGGGAPEQANHASFPGWMSIDGRYASFFSSAANIAPGTSGVSPGGGVILSSYTTVWVYDGGNAGQATAKAENRAIELSFTLHEASRFTLNWGDGSSLTGQAQSGDSFNLDKIYAVHGIYDASLLASGSGGSTKTPLKIHLMPNGAAANIQGWSGIDLIFAGNGADTISAANGADVVHGGGGGDYLLGGAGADTLYGEAGDDIFRDGPGVAFADVYVGGAGTNAVDYRGVAEPMSIVLDGSALRFGATTAGLATVFGPGGEVADALFDIHIAYGGKGGNAMIGSALADTLVAGNGGDDLDGGDGADSLVGGKGADYIQGGLGDDSISAGANADIIIDLDGNNFVEGGSGADTFQSGTGDDTFLGGDGADLIFVRGGQDSIDGGTGVNTLILEKPAGSETGSWTVNLGAGVANSLVSADTVAFENISTIGSTVDIDVSGTAGNEVFLLGTGLSSFAGGGGVDLLSGRLLFSALVINAASPSGSGTASFAGGDTIGGALIANFQGIRDFEGSPLNDTITGSDQSNRILGGGGDDELHAGPGRDRLTGGEGGDTFVFDSIASQGARILDFDAAGFDRLDINPVLIGAPGRDVASLAFGGFFELRQTGLDVEFMVDADGGADSWTLLVTLMNRTVAQVGFDFLVP